MKSKVLININDLKEIEEYRKIGITNFLFAIENYSIGYNTFKIDEIPDNSYLLVNRVLDTSSIDEFNKLIPKLDRFKGIIFEDLGIFNLLKDSNLELIWNQAHFVTNYSSINNYLSLGCSSCVLSNEITSEEIKEILDKVNKPIIFNILSKNMVMYSRRKLVSNYNKVKDLGDFTDADIKEEKTKTYFSLKENEYGTVVFNNSYFNYIEFAKSLDDNKIKYYLILNNDLSVKEIEEILDGKEFGNDGFLNKKTVYKMSEYTDRGDKQ